MSMSLWITAVGALLIMGGMIWSAIKIESNLAIAVMTIGIITILSSAAFAHDHDRPGLSDWYSGLRSGKGPCCDGPGKDAIHLESDDWESKDGHYRVRLNGNWIDVPDEAVLKEPNKDGRTLVWPVKYYDGETLIRCFIPGALT